jgi:flagellar M-ring protein FliF
VLGPDNIAVPNGATGNGTFTSEDNTRNNAVNKVTENRTIPAGALTRQTVSVALNKEVAGDINVADVTSLVSSAAGIDTRRGDAVTVEMVSFNSAGAKAAAEALAQAEQSATADRMAEIIRIGIIVAGTIIAFVLGLILYARRSRRQTREAIELGELNQERMVLEGMTMPIGIEAPTIPMLITPSTLPQEGAPGDANRRRADIDALAARDPEKTADFLRGLMEDRQPV